VTTIFTANEPPVGPTALDSVVVDPSANRIIFSESNAGMVRSLDRNTGIDTLVAGGLTNPADLFLEPGGQTVLVSEVAGGRIDRIDLTTHQVTLFINTPGGTPEGLAYDCDGRLFAVLGSRFGELNSFLAELDPVTGQILQRSPNLTFLDGLVFDTFSGKLYAASFARNSIYAFDPNNVANVTELFAGLIPIPDGMTADGAGNVFIAAFGSNIYRYNIPTNSLTALIPVTTGALDDLAPPPVCVGTGPIQPGQTAAIGFWNNQNGQALINNFNSGPTSTVLGNWLATTFPNLYGAGAGANNLTGQTNAQVAAFYRALFAEGGPKVDAQVLAAALNVYAMTTSLGGQAAAQFGFTVTVAGLGGSTFNVGSSGAAFGVPNNSTLTVFQILRAANNRAVHGILYNGDLTLRDLALTVFDGLNGAGDIG
jgi:sugar lactone lactonase YvrE